MKSLLGDFYISQEAFSGVVAHVDCLQYFVDDILNRFNIGRPSRPFMAPPLCKSIRPEREWRPWQTI